MVAIEAAEDGMTWELVIPLRGDFLRDAVVRTGTCVRGRGRGFPSEEGALSRLGPVQEITEAVTDRLQRVQHR